MFLGRRKQRSWFLHSSCTWRANLKKCLGQPRWGTSMGHHVRTRCRWPTMLASTRRKKSKKPLRGYFCPLTTGGLISVRPGRGKDQPQIFEVISVVEQAAMGQEREPVVP